MSFNIKIWKYPTFQIADQLSWLTSHVPEFDEDIWASLIQQSMLLVIIVARWTFPVYNYEISRDQISQLLFLLLGVGFDIIDLFALFDEQKVLEHPILVYCILIFWSLSIIQFAFFLTAIRDRVPASKLDPEDQYQTKKKKKNISCGFCSSEIWSIAFMSTMLDFPFLAVRLTAIIYFNINNYSIYFFTCKNILVLLLQAYRLIVICSKQCHDNKVDSVSVSPVSNDVKQPKQPSSSSSTNSTSLDVEANNSHNTNPVNNHIINEKS